MPAARPLELILRVAGAVMTTRHGRRVAAHYGSAAGELAVCIRSVGLVDRSELSVLGVSGRAERLGDAVSRLVGIRVAPGGSAHVGEAWWGRLSAGELLVISQPQVVAHLSARLRAETYRFADLAVCDHSDDYASIGLIGRAAPALLATLGAYGDAGDPRSARPFGPGEVGGVDVLWLLESDHSAIALVRRDVAGTVWQAIEEAGRPFSLSCVGRDAVERFSLLDRARVRSAVARTG
jgi:glycine cleavage system aminomethyltransferase T